MITNDTPLVTFITTYYNLPTDMLCECIDSILALSLTPQEREIIVVDDGSDRSPMNELMQYGDQIVYVRQKNGGISTARNTALAMAKGRYVQIVDGDDCLIKEPYEHCLDILRKHDDADMIMFDFTHSPENTNDDVGEPLKYNGPQLMRSTNICGTAWCYLFRQSVRGKLTFTPGIAYGEDEEFTPQLLIRSEVVYVTKVKAYYYREHEDSATHRHDKTSIDRHLADHMTVLCNLNKLSDTLPQEYRTAMQRRVAQLAMDQIYNTIMLTRSEERLGSTLKELHDLGLFPLPDRDYTQKYKWFRRITNSRIGRSLLLHTLPLMKPER